MINSILQTSSLLEIRRACLGAAALLASLAAVVRADPPSTTPPSPSTPASTSIVANGGAFAWGNSNPGSLGTANGTPGNAPGQVQSATDGASFQTGVTCISAGQYHGIAVRNGAVYTWGDNTFSQLGTGPNGPTNASAPVRVTTLSDVVTAVSAGALFNLAITKNGALLSWGNNGSNALGYSTTNLNNYTPMSVPGMDSGVTAVAGGAAHGLAIKDGCVYAWGYNIYGQVGNGDTNGNNVLTPFKIATLGNSATAISAGGHNSMAIVNNVAYVWGVNNVGQANANSSVTRRYAPTAVTGLPAGNVTAIASGDSFSVAVVGGHVYGWGGNHAGQLGNGTTDSSPHPAPALIDSTDLHDIVAVSIAGQSIYVLRNDGTLWVWGDNTSLQLGLGNGYNASNYPTPHQILPPYGSYYSAITGGGFHAAAVRFVPPSSFFTGEAYVGNGTFYLSFPNGNYFGYYGFLSDIRYFYHQDLGYEFVVDANDGVSGVYFYDFASSTWFYTSPTYGFPYLYDFTLHTVLYYYPNSSMSGRYTTNPRYFYNFNTGSIITK